MGWVKEAKQSTKEIFCDVTSKIKWNDIPDDSSTPYEFFVDYLRDNYEITLKQCDRLCIMLRAFYNIEDFYYREKKTTYSERYKELKKQEEKLINNALDEVVLLFKNKHNEPVKYGNMVYFYCNEEGKDVPAYKYISSADCFEPIYDRYNTVNFGWSDISQVMKILDVIKEHI